MTRAARIAQLHAYRDHYAAKEQEPLVTRPDDPRNPWTGLRRACERVLDRLERQEAACTDPPTETSDDRSAPRSAASG